MSLAKTYENALEAHYKPISNDQKDALSALKKAVEYINREGTFNARIENAMSQGYYLTVRKNASPRLSTDVILTCSEVEATYLSDTQSTEKLVDLVIQRLGEERAKTLRAADLKRLIR